MNVTFYSFSKKENSTKQPGGGSGYNVALKEPSSVLAPVIRLIWTGAGSPVHFNYAFIPSYSRYYFVRNWTYAERQWQAELVVDPLASWKTYIGAATKYVVRADSVGKKNDYVKDGMYPVTFNQTIEYGTPVASPIYQPDISSGGFVFGVLASPSSGAIGGVTYYSMDATNANTLMNALYQKAYQLFDTSWTSSDIGEALMTFGQNLVKSILNPMQFVVSAMWFPSRLTTGTTVSNIYLGAFATGASGDVISTPAAPDGGTDIPMSTLPIHVYNGEYEWIEPYTMYCLEYEPFGIIPLSAIDLVNATKVTVQTTVDYVSGLGVCRVLKDGDSSQLLATRTAQVGVQLSVSGTSINGQGIIANTVGAVANLAAENYIGAAGNILQATNDFVQDARSSGTSGGFAGLVCTPSIKLIRRYSPSVDTDPTEHGYPVMAPITINTLSGFVMVDEGDIAAPATMQELAQIKSYLEGGFFYE